MNDLVKKLPMTKIAEFCRRWKIRQLEVFGSVLRANFNAESDIDLIVTFEDEADWSLLDHIKMQQELQALLQRDVDLFTKRAVDECANWVRRREILKAAFPIYTKSKVLHEAR